MLPMSLTLAMRQVRGMAEKDVPFERIEAFVEYETPDLEPEERDVLWLYAWCGADAHSLREVLGEHAVPSG